MKEHSDTQQLQEIYQRLLSHYGPQGWWPLYNNKTRRIEYHPGDYSFPKDKEQSFEVSVGTILTQNTRWNNVERVLYNLQHERLLTKHALHSTPEKKLALLIRPAGYFNQKAKKLKAFAAFAGEISRSNLLSLWGIGKETADSILCYAYHLPLFVVDAYTIRIFRRLGFQETTYESIQQRVMQECKGEAFFNEFHALLVELGKNVCTQRTPSCPVCPLEKACKKVGVTVAARSS